MFVATHSFEAKGGKELLDAFRRVRKVIPDVTLTMIGKDWGIDEPGIECLGFLDKRNSGDLAIYKRCLRRPPFLYFLLIMKLLVRYLLRRCHTVFHVSGQEQE